MSDLAVKEMIEKIILNASDDLDYLLYETSIYLKGEKTKLTVKIDNLKGITHEDCAIFSRELFGRLDKEELLPDYSLEVSSPGLSRKIRSIEEFKRFIGSPVKIIFEVDGSRSIIKGVVKNVIDTVVEMESDKEEYKIEFDSIIKANLEY